MQRRAPPRWNTQRRAEELARLSFNPVEEMVLLYRRLEEELDYNEALRSGELRQDGKPKAYSPERHMAVYDRLITVASNIMRNRVESSQLPVVEIICDSAPLNLPSSSIESPEKSQFVPVASVKHG